MAKRKNKQERRETKVTRLARKILTQTIWPANLQLEEAIEVVARVAKELVLANTSDEDPVDRSELIDAVEDHFISILTEIDPLADPALADRAHLWLVPPQGDITEPFGILWDGGYAEDSVKGVLGTELALLREEFSATRDKTKAILVEGLEGVAVIVPDWDGEDTVVCEDCDKVHNVHLTVAEGLFQRTIARRQQRLSAN